MKFIPLVILSTLLTGCAFTRDYVDIEYKPNCTPQEILGAENVEVAVHIDDVRFKENIGCKINGYGIEMANIMASNDLSEVFKNAIIWELEQRGFVITCGGNHLDVELIKFFNNFKPIYFGARADSETILNVTLRNENGVMVYSKTIFGFGEEEICFLAGGNNARLALERSLYQAIQKLMKDPGFIGALLESN